MMINHDEKKLFLFTGSYPYSEASENTFIEPELPFLSQLFKTIILIPKSNKGKIAAAPDYIDTDLSLSEGLEQLSRFAKIILAFSSSLFYREIIHKPSILYNMRHFRARISYLAIAVFTSRWLLKYIRENAIDISKTIFYTYWFDEITLGLLIGRMKNPSIKVITRAHGSDIYEERHIPPHIHFREFSLQYVTRVFPDSAAGLKYLCAHYPQFCSKIELGKMGVEDPLFITKRSEDGIFRVVSCSYIQPIKRLDLLLLSLKALGIQKPEKTIEWTHIGDGPMRMELSKEAERILPQNVKNCFLGYLPEGKVIEFYKTHPIDVFVNVSSSEGTPVSIMEAQSCGIPVIVTGVGGNTEIVNEDVGIVLTQNPTPEEIAWALEKIMENENETVKKKINSKNNWLINYNSHKNYTDFAKKIHELL